MLSTTAHSWFKCSESEGQWQVMRPWKLEFSQNMEESFQSPHLKSRVLNHSPEPLHKDPENLHLSKDFEESFCAHSGLRSMCLFFQPSSCKKSQNTHLRIIFATLAKLHSLLLDIDTFRHLCAPGCYLPYTSSQLHLLNICINQP